MIAACLVFATAFVIPTLVFAAPATVDVQKETSAPFAESTTVQKLFTQFGLFGRWAIDCKQPAGPDNPHIRITMPSPELVMENHDLGPDYAINRYSVLSAERISATRLSVGVIFQPGTENEERQKLVFLIRNGTRRTLFNQPDDGPVRVKDGIALVRGVKTPLLMKCD